MERMEEVRERKSRKRDWEQDQSKDFMCLVDLGWKLHSQECLMLATVSEPS